MRSYVVQETGLNTRKEAKGLPEPGALQLNQRECSNVPQDRLPNLEKVSAFVNFLKHYEKSQTYTKENYMNLLCFK